MAEDTQKEPRTLYLMYKIAVRGDDREAATTCLEGISKVREPLEYLYACCLDAQEARHKQFAIEALSKLVEKNAHSPSSTIHLPALLRCTLRLMVKEYEDLSDETEDNNKAQKICDVFNEVVTAISSSPQSSTGTALFTLPELDWFARTAYNLSLTQLDRWDVTQTISLLTSCNSILSHFPADVSSDLSSDIALKTLFNDFIISSALLARARARDSVEDQLQDYLLMRRHIASFDAALPAQLPALVEKARDDMSSKLGALLTFDFEAALALKDYPSLPSIVRRTAPCNSPTPLQAQADILLRASLPSQTLYTTLRLIIDSLAALDSLDVTKLSRYMRCLFQVTLPLDESLALDLTREYVAVIKEARDKDAPVPDEETEWLATTAYNHAVDCYFQKKDEVCKGWAFRAFELAHLVGDGGVLEEVLHRGFIKLKFDAA